MVYPGAKQIAVFITFPNGEHGRPEVSNSTSEVDEVAANFTSIEWSAAPDTSQDDNIRISGVTFWTDATKTVQTDPGIFGPGFNNGRENWVLPILPTASVPNELDLIYTLDFVDDDYNDLRWDPTVKIKPRTAAEGAAGAGGH